MGSVHSSAVNCKLKSAKAMEISDRITRGPAANVRIALSSESRRGRRWATGSESRSRVIWWHQTVVFDSVSCDRFEDASASTHLAFESLSSKLFRLQWRIGCEQNELSGGPGFILHRTKKRLIEHSHDGFASAATASERRAASNSSHCSGTRTARHLLHLWPIYLDLCTRPGALRRLLGRSTCPA